MLSMLIAGLFMVFTVNIFNFSFTYMGVQRAYLGLYKGVVESCVIPFDRTGNNTKPYFGSLLLELRVGEYFSSSLRKYTSSYSLDYFYFDSVSEENDNDYPDGVIISFSASISSTSSYSKKARFVIKEQTNG